MSPADGHYASTQPAAEPANAVNQGHPSAPDDAPLLPPRRAASLRARLLLATVAGLAVALLLAGLGLAELFRAHVQHQFEAQLQVQLDQLTARLEFDADGRPGIDPASLSDPRWLRPFGGLYWQIDAAPSGEPGAAPPQRAVARSRSLWDAVIALPVDDLPSGSQHTHEALGPQDQPLLVVERTLRAPDAQRTVWRLLVGADQRSTQAAVRRFNGLLAGALALLGLLLALAAWAQVAIGLAPVRRLQPALAALRAGRQRRLAGQFPAELQPLVDDFNAVLDRNAEVVQRARTQAGNLAHAIKTPLAVLQQAAADAQQPGAAAQALPELVRAQVGLARRHVDWHLARSRAAAAQGLPGARVAVAPLLASLQHVFDTVHAARAIDLSLDAVSPQAQFAGEAQDLQELLGNLIDNAFKWARHAVQIAAWTEGAQLHITVDDDGPGIPPERRATALARGARLDESVPGSGLGLAIVAELVALYQGQLALDQSPDGGLRVRLSLPAPG